MLKIYDVPTAQNTILKRTPLHTKTYPPRLVKSVEALFGEGITPAGAVSIILESISQDGDTALKKWSSLIDKADLKDFRIPSEDLKSAYDGLDPSLLDALQLAAERIREFHEHQPLPNWETEKLGGILGQRVTAVEKAGVYVPGGTAPLPSSLLMSVIPAQVAGVEEIIVCTPPNPHASILACAYLCGIDQVYQLGGAQAIGAMTFGTETVPKVDKIVGAGNLFVTLAKQQVYGIVGLDNLAGPTETMVIADTNANPAWVASDLLAQAEHDPLASAILLTPDRALAEAVQVEIGKQMETLSRTSVIEQSLENFGGIVITPDIDTAAQLADDYGAEHLCLCVNEPRALLNKIRNAGGFFMGEHSFEVLGDYVAGPSHVMPTSGTARFASPLNVMDFVKISSIIALDAATARDLSVTAAQIADTEELTAHAAAARQRQRMPDA